jgi:hypothetical protein
MNTFFTVTAERSRQYRIVGVAAVLMAAIAVGVMFAVNANRPQPTGGLPVGATVSPSAPASSPEPSPVPSPSASATPAPISSSNQAAFVCSSSTISAKQSPMTAFVDAIRTGSHPGYDRVTVEFKNGQADSISISPQAGTTFHQAPSGKADTLAGKNGILVIIRGADAHTEYSGVRDIKTSNPSLAEVRVLEDFEGQISLGLGLKQAACYRASVLANPVRLVIDTQVA